MRTARARSAAMAAGLAAISLACETPLGPEAASGETLSGEWVACRNDGAADQLRVVQFFPDSFSSTTRTYATRDGSCGGGETGAAREIWRYTLKGAVPARIGDAGLEVLARELDVENSFETVFTIVYVDETVTPSLLYLGDLSSDPLLDGTAPDRRPRLLSASDPLAGQ